MAYKSAKFFQDEYQLSRGMVYKLIGEMGKLDEYRAHVKQGILRVNPEAFDRYLGERNKYRWRELAR